MRQKFKLDPEVGVRLLPNLQSCQRQGSTRYLMRTNGEGFRTRDVDLTKRPGSRRILVYGDSFTEGAGVSDGQRFTDFLERALPDTEFVNYGVSATGTDQQLLLFRQRSPNLEHDLVVVGLYVDDVRRNGTRHMVFTNAMGDAHYEKPYFVLEGEELVLKNVPVPAAPSKIERTDKSRHERGVIPMLKRLGRATVQRCVPQAKGLLERVVRTHAMPSWLQDFPDHGLELQSADDPAWRITLAIVRQWAAESEVPLLVVAIPPYHYVARYSSSRGYERRFEEMAAEGHFRVHDVLPDLRRTADTEGIDAVRLADDTHLTARGHEVIAESLGPVVSEMLASAGAARTGSAE